MAVLFNEVRHRHSDLHGARCHAVTGSVVTVLLNYSFLTTVLWIHIKFTAAETSLLMEGKPHYYYISHDAQGSGWIIT